MSEKCVSVFYVGKKKLSVEVREKINKELSPTHIHEIPSVPFNRRGSLTALIKQAKTVMVCVERSSVPISEIKIAAVNNNLSFFVLDKTKTEEGEMVHSSKITSSNFN